MLDGPVVAGFRLAHGVDPRSELEDRGWEPVRALRASGAGGDPDDLVVEVLVRPRPAGGPGRPRGGVSDPAGGVPGRTVPSDAGLELAPGERIHVAQRVAAYAVLTSARGLLLTQLSGRVRGGAGRWTLPGGGLDPGELPVEALVREVWEETGHEVADVELLDLRTSHWVGRAPGGRMEDFHAVRLVHHGRCARVTDPVVHDVGGSTSRAAWVPFERVPSLRLAAMVAPHWRRWVGSAPSRGGDPDEPEGREDQPGGDDDVRPPH